MPGTTPNTTIKNGIDQVIVALNDLNLSSDIGDIVAKLEEIRTLYETESLAAVVAQNTNFSDLITAMQALTLSCQTIVNTTHQTYNLNCGGCGGGGGSTPPTPPTNQDDPPPYGWQPTPDEPGEPAYQSRKCKIANLLHDEYRQWMQLWENYGVDNYSVITLVALTTLLGYSLGEILTPFPILDGVAGSVIGFISGIALAILEGGFDLGQILNLMDEHQDELVCALYNSEDTASAKESYIQILLDNGLSTPNRALFEAAFAIDALTHLFFVKSSPEAGLDGYEGEVDCSACGPGTGPYTVVLGTETTENPSNPIDIDPAFIGVESCLEVMINFHQAVSITEIGFGGGSEDQNFDSCGAFNRFWYYSSEDQVDLIFSSNGFPHQNVVPTGVRSVYIRWEGHDIAGNWEPGFVTVFYSIDE